ncbi:nitrilase and fragile histidine triad fusion protein NitFhit isoform X2 [Anabrus simplex]
MSAIHKCVVAVCQMTSGNDKDRNLQTCRDLIMDAHRQHAKIVFLPEACDYIGDNKDDVAGLAEPLDGPLMTSYQELARKYSMWLSLGGIHEKAKEGKVSNSHVLIDDEGNIKAVYRKIHLFDVDIPESGVSLKESNYVTPGEEIVDPVETPLGKIGLGICYDVRFPEFSFTLANMGADVLTYPSAFTYTTGAAHWELLLRARAVETQTFVIAAAQTGAHNKKRSSWGHAMIVDPWGTVIAQCPEGTGCAVAELNLAQVSSTRTSMPVRNHRRNDLYPRLEPHWKPVDHDRDVYQFGQSTVKYNQVFLRTKFTIAFTNKRCAVPGHVLVSPIRCVKRYSELDVHEIKDLWLTVQRVQKVIEAVNNAEASTITIQDGADAGQTIQHVHVHILPRRPGDFARNDDVYVALEKKDSLECRSEKEMVEEAQALRLLFDTMYH